MSPISPARAGKPSGRTWRRTARNSVLGSQVDYLAREGAEGQAKYNFYDRSEIDLDAKGLTTVWVEDSRHFRLIVSAEDGAALGELRPFIRQHGLVTRGLAKLKSRLSATLVRRVVLLGASFR